MMTVSYRFRVELRVDLTKSPEVPSSEGDSRFIVPHGKDGRRGRGSAGPLGQAGARAAGSVAAIITRSGKEDSAYGEVTGSGG
jgi:hypothetical protein